ncbi:MAG TPA: beta-L-arabinofuranosidase domain-containing protein, partial [Acidobacteriaceae bacterium]|nr:beta-L-arabinofuranosidase domain-containing protein [Acidobacteriaceae bacterium]
MNFSALNRRDFLRTLAATGIASAAGTISAETQAGSATGSANLASNTAESMALHRLNPLTLAQVVVDDEFWSPKRRVWQQVTIRDCFRKFENYQTGTLNNFDRVKAGERGHHAGDPWWDGLIYEMIRGSADFMLSHPDPELEAQIDGYIERIAAAQAIRPDGYINTYTQLA